MAAAVASFSSADESHHRTPRQKGLYAYKHMCVSEDGSWCSEPRTFNCWHCTRQFFKQPIPIPTAYDVYKSQYKVTGQFCSFQCAKAFMVGTVGYETPLMVSYLKQMARECFGYAGNTIHQAPGREFLPIFNSIMTWEEFDEILQSGEPCETLRNTLIPQCALKSSSLLMVHGKPSVAMRDVLSTRNNETEIDDRRGSEDDGRAPARQSMYSKFLEKTAETSSNAAADVVEDSDSKKNEAADEDEPMASVEGQAYAISARPPAKRLKKTTTKASSKASRNAAKKASEDVANDKKKPSPGRTLARFIRK